MHTYSLSLPGQLHLRLVLPFPVFDDVQARLLLGAYLPGTNFVFEPPEAPCLSVIFRQSQKPRIVRAGKQITVYDQWRGQPSLLDFIHLTYGACRLFWLSQGLYCVHSALVDDLLVVGHSGAGKTSTALRQAALGRKVFSANKTLLSICPQGRLVAVAGTRTITTKAADAQKHLGEASGVDFVGRAAWLLNESMYSGAPRQPVRRIAITQLNDGADDYAALSALSALHRLYPFFLDAVNADAIVCGGTQVLAGTPPRGIQQALTDQLLPALSHVSVCAVTGSMQFITSALEGNQP